MKKKLDGNYTRNAVSNIEQVLEATPHETAAVQPPPTHHKQLSKLDNAGHCCKNGDKLISDIFLWTPSHGRAKAGQPARTYIQQLCANTGCSLEDLLGAMDDRDGWQDRVREICTGGTT